MNINIKMDGLYGKSASNLSKMIDEYLSKLKIRLHKYSITKMLVNFDYMQWSEIEEIYIQIKSIDHIAEGSNGIVIWPWRIHLGYPELHLRLAVTETSKKHTKTTLDELAKFVSLLKDSSAESVLTKENMNDKLMEIVKTINIIQQCELKTILNYYCLEITTTTKISSLIDKVSIKEVFTDNLDSKCKD